MVRFPDDDRSKDEVDVETQLGKLAFATWLLGINPFFIYHDPQSISGPHFPFRP